MNEPTKTTEAQLSQEALEIIRWQEEHADVWSMKVSEQPDAPYECYAVDEAVLRENLKLTPVERLSRMGERLPQHSEKADFYLTRAKQACYHMPCSPLLSPGGGTVYTVDLNCPM